MLDKLRSLVREAGQIVLGGYSVIDNKGSDSNMVTDSDSAVQSFLVDGLKQLFLDIDFICEEVSDKPNSAQREFTAVIDPIDGTSNFVRGMNLSAISVAVLHYGKPWLGVVYLPFTDEMFAAEARRGAFLNGKPIHVSDRSRNASCMATAWSLYDKSLAGVCFDICQEAYPQIDDLRRLGACALELCYLACGRCELYFEIRVFPWDFAAGVLIIREAGGFVRQIGTYDGDYGRPSSLIAANSADSLEWLQEIVGKHLPEDLYKRSAFDGIL